MHGLDGRIVGHFAPLSLFPFFQLVIVEIGGERSIRSLTQRFNKIKETYYVIAIILPFKNESASGNKIFIYHLGRKHKDDPEGGFTHLMAYVVIENGKIALVNFLHYDEEENAQSHRSSGNWRLSPIRN